MNDVKEKKKKCFLDDPRLDLELLGFYRITLEDEPDCTIYSYRLDLTEELSIDISTTFSYGERVETTTELVMGTQAEVIDIRNIYDLYIQIATYRPERLNPNDNMLEVLSDWGTVLSYSCTDDVLKIRIKDICRDVGNINHFLLYIRQLYPEYTTVDRFYVGSKIDLQLTRRRYG